MEYDFREDPEATLARMIAEAHQLRGTVTLRHVERIDRRLDYLVAYIKRHSPVDFVLHGAFPDCHRLIPTPVLVTAPPRYPLTDVSQAGILAAFSKGHDPRTWTVPPAHAEGFARALEQWKTCVWAGNIQEQMKQPITFSWQLGVLGQTHPPAAQCPDGTPAAGRCRTRL